MGGYRAAVNMKIKKYMRSPEILTITAPFRNLKETSPRDFFRKHARVPRNKLIYYTHTREPIQ